MQRRLLLADDAHVHPPDQLGARGLGGVQGRFRLRPGGGVGAQQHDADDHGRQRGDRRLGRIGDHRQHGERDPDRAGGNGELGRQRESYGSARSPPPTPRCGLRAARSRRGNRRLSMAADRSADAGPAKSGPPEPMSRHGFTPAGGRVGDWPLVIQGNAAVDRPDPAAFAG